MTRPVLPERLSKAAKPPGGAQSAPPSSQQGASSQPRTPSTSSSSPSADELRAIAGKALEATSSTAQEMSTVETVALSARGSDRTTGKNGQVSTTASTTFSADSKSGAANVKAGTADAAALNVPRSGDRTFVGQPKPRDPTEIGLGSLVLAHEGPDEGWWEAEVIGINGRVFSLRWRDYPTQPTILRKATELALLPPGGA